MKRYYKKTSRVWLLAALLMICLNCQTGFATANHMGVNLILNGGFEFCPAERGSNWIDFWQRNPTYPANARVLANGERAHSGRQFLQLSKATVNREAAVFQFSRVVQKASSYKLTCYARGAAAALRLFIYEYGLDNNFRGAKSSKMFYLSDEWTLCSLEYKCDKNVKFVAPALHVGSGTVDIDDVVFMAVGYSSERMKVIQERPWKGNRIGLSHDVPPPFQPLRVALANGKRLEMDGAPLEIGGPIELKCWGREYHLAESALPLQILSQGKKLLTDPVKLTTEPRRWELRLQGLRLVDFHQDSATVQSSAMLMETEQPAAIDLIITTELEFDGVMRVDVELKPRTDVRMNRLALEIPLQRDTARLCYYRTYQWRDYFGAVPKSAWHFRFTPTLWLGNHERGLAWFADSPKGWRYQDEDKQLELIPQATARLLRVNFINKPTLLHKPMTFTFGLLATPPKSVPRTVQPQHVRTLHMPDHSPNVKISYIITPLEGDPLEYHLSKKEKTEVVRKVKDAHDKGRLAVAWMQLRMISLLPEYTQHISDWFERPARTFRGQYVYYCPQSEWSEMLLYAIDRLFKEYEFDGVYFDTGVMHGCANPVHGCGYRDVRGRWQQSFPVFATREFKKRLFRLLTKRVGSEHAYISTLVNGSMDIAALTFDTAVISGEEWNGHLRGKEDYRAVTSLDQFVVQYDPGIWGLWSVLLPSRSVSQTASATDSLLSFSLLCNTPLWIAYCKESRCFSAINTLSDFGGTFLPPWRVKNALQVSDTHCRCAAYLRDGEMLLVISNFGNHELNAKVDVNVRSLHLLHHLHDAQDALTGEAIESHGDQLIVPVSRASFKLVHVK